jgi:hypothetical protein
MNKNLNVAQSPNFLTFKEPRNRFLGSLEVKKFGIFIKNSCFCVFIPPRHKELAALDEP